MSKLNLVLPLAAFLMAVPVNAESNAENANAKPLTSMHGQTAMAHAKIQPASSSNQSNAENDVRGRLGNEKDAPANAAAVTTEASKLKSRHGRSQMTRERVKTDN